MRDIVDYQLIAMESCLYQAAVRREDMLRDFYTDRQARCRAQDAVRVCDSRPTARSRRDAACCSRRWHSARSRSSVRAAPFTAGGKQYEAGSYVIRMQQPYSSFAKTLLERQQYPDLRLYPGGPPKRPMTSPPTRCRC